LFGKISVEYSQQGIFKTSSFVLFSQSSVARGKGGIFVYIVPVEGLEFFLQNIFGIDLLFLEVVARGQYHGTKNK